MAGKTWTKPEPVVRKPFVPSYTPSEEQEEIFRAMHYTEDNLHCEASPGSGKSTTTVWAMTKNRRMNGAFFAFAKANVVDIEPRCPLGITVKTAHSFGYGSLAARYGKLFVNNDKVKKILMDNWPKLMNPFEVTGKERAIVFDRLSNTINLIDKMRNCLVDENEYESIINTMDKYNISIDVYDDVISLLPQIFGLIEAQPSVIDFTDMMWMPIRLGLPIPKFPMIYVDERQDLNPLMIEYVFQLFSERIMTVGDVCQSIFGFTGADTKSTEKLIERFGGQELGLNTCYRCGTDIVKFASEVYDKIKPFSKNPTGDVNHAEDLDYDMPDGSMILSRRNAGLIKPCFDLLKRGRKATIKGNDIGAGISKLITQMNATDVFDLKDKIEMHRHDRIEKLMSRKTPVLSSIQHISDQCDCIIQFAEQCQTVPEILNKLGQIFDDKTKGIV